MKKFYGIMSQLLNLKQPTYCIDISEILNNSFRYYFSTKTYFKNIFVILLVW